NETRGRPGVECHPTSPRVEEPVLRSPLRMSLCANNAISSPQGAELLARYSSDARTTVSVPLELGNCRHRKYLRGGKECPEKLSVTVSGRFAHSACQKGRRYRWRRCVIDTGLFSSLADLQDSNDCCIFCVDSATSLSFDLKWR